MSDKGLKPFTIAVILLLMWVGVMGLLYFKADEVTKNPCQICAEKLGEAVWCTASNSGINVISFHPNGSIYYNEK